MPIQATRTLLDAALSGELDGVEYRVDPTFGLEVPVEVPGVDSGLLDPRSTWADPLGIVVGLKDNPTAQGTLRLSRTPLKVDRRGNCDAPRQAGEEDVTGGSLAGERAALVVAMIALFVALGGTAGAVVTAAVPLAKRRWSPTTRRS